MQPQRPKRAKTFSTVPPLELFPHVIRVYIQPCFTPVDLLSAIPESCSERAFENTCFLQVIPSLCFMDQKTKE